MPGGFRTARLHFGARPRTSRWNMTTDARGSQVRNGLSAGGNRIRTIGTALRKGSLGSAEQRCRTDRLDGIMKPRSSRETSVVARGSLFDGRLVDGGTDGSNPSPSTEESHANLSFRGASHLRWSIG